MDREPNGNGVRITQREVYDAVIRLNEKVSSLERKVDITIRDAEEMRHQVRSIEVKVYALMAGLIGAVSLIAAKGVAW